MVGDQNAVNGLANVPHDAPVEPGEVIQHPRRRILKNLIQDEVLSSVMIAEIYLQDFKCQRFGKQKLCFFFFSGRGVTRLRARKAVPKKATS